MGRDRALVRDRKAHGMGDMTALLLSFLSSPTMLAIGGGLVAVIVAFMKGRTSGAARERQKQAGERQKAREVADRIDSEIGALPPDDAREALKKWSR